jgi:hypothetical protein
MTKNAQGGAQSTNQGTAPASPATDLNIPRMGAGAPPSIPIVTQEGEDEEELRRASEEQVARVRERAAQSGQTVGAIGAPTVRPDPVMASEDAGAGTPLHSAQTLAQLQVNVDTSARNRALNAPVVTRYGNDLGESLAPKQTVAIPGLEVDLSQMNRDDLEVQPLDSARLQKQKAAELAFLEELVIINIHQTGELGAEDPVPLGVNGRMCYVRRGVDTIVRRKYVEQLLRAKPQTVSTEQQRKPNGDVANLVHKHSSLKYPFAIVRDDNPRGRVWQRNILQQV